MTIDFSNSPGDCGNCRWLGWRKVQSGSNTVEKICKHPESLHKFRHYRTTKEMRYSIELCGYYGRYFRNKWYIKND